MPRNVAMQEDEIARVIARLVRSARPLASVDARSAETDKYKAAVTALDKALRETVLYMERLKDGSEHFDKWKESDLSQLWSEASVAISSFDPHLANACFIKGQGWIQRSVWADKRYREFPTSIDDMRTAIMKLHEERPIEVDSRVPSWYPVAGLVFSAATFFSLFYLLLGPEISPSKRSIFNAWMAFCVAASGAFLGGSAAAHGTIGAPFSKENPLRFSIVGGVAIFVVVLGLMTLANG